MRLTRIQHWLYWYVQHCCVQTDRAAGFIWWGTWVLWLNVEVEQGARERHDCDTVLRSCSTSTKRTREATAQQYRHVPSIRPRRRWCSGACAFDAGE